MYLIIIGLGRVGRNLVKLAIANRDDVVVIDRKRERCEAIAKEFDVVSIVGDSTAKEVLEKAGIEKADALISATSDDAINLMTCLLAKKLGVPSLVSVVNQPEHVEMFRRSGINIQENPEAMVAAYLYKIVQKPHIRDFISLVNNQAEIFSVVVEDDSEAVGKEINEMGFDRDVLVIAIEREKKLIIPRGDTKIEGGDLLYIFTPQKSLEHVTSLFSGK